MEQILEKLETLIDDLERDSQLTRDEIHGALVKLKGEIEDYQIRKDERDLHRDFSFEDLD